MQFKIYEGNIERLEKKMTRIRNKCNKYGCGFVYEQVGEEFKTLHKGTPKECVARFVIVNAEGTAVINGWEFVATLEHNKEGNIVRKCKDIDIPERYYYCEQECEHCHSKRHRKDTYLVHNIETGEFKQVGSSCLCDFTGGLSAEGVAAYIELFDELIEGETPYPGVVIDECYDLDLLLSYTLELVSKIGYTSSAAAYDYGYTSTKSYIRDIWYYTHNGRLSRVERETIEDLIEKNNLKFSDEIDPRVEAIKEYALSLDESNDYEHNIKVIAKSDYVKSSQLGFAVSIIPSYLKHIEREAYKAKKAEEVAGLAASSEFQGTIGSRITFEVSESKTVSGYDTPYGYVYLHQIVDKYGNVYMWSTSNSLNGYDEHYKLSTITGTVKEYKEFRGVKQTWLTRCRPVFVDTCSAS